MRIERWSMQTDGGPYLPHELQAYVIAGEIHGHPAHAGGASIVTSRIVAVRDGKVHTKSGAVYELGEVDPDYEAAYPGARERLMRRCK